MRGTATIVGNDPTKAEIDVTFDATALTAPDSVTLGRLKGEKFFWVEQHPRIRFKGQGLSMTSATKGTITGQLTARGVTRDQSLSVTFDQDPLKAGANAPIAFAAKTKIDRRQFGMRSFQLIVGNKVDITFQHKRFEQLTGKLLSNYDVLVGSDICFWDEMTDLLYKLIRRALRNGVQSIYIADPGRTPFLELAEKTIMTNYFGVQAVCRALFPLLRPHAR